jgi:hypothetical protein
LIWTRGEGARDANFATDIRPDVDHDGARTPTPRPQSSRCMGGTVTVNTSGSGRTPDATGQRASVGNEPTVRAGRHFANKTTSLSSAVAISWSWRTTDTWSCASARGAMSQPALTRLARPSSPRPSGQIHPQARSPPLDDTWVVQRMNCKARPQLGGARASLRS